MIMLNEKFELFCPVSFLENGGRRQAQDKLVKHFEVETVSCSSDEGKMTASKLRNCNKTLTQRQCEKIDWRTHWCQLKCNVIISNVEYQKR